MHILCTGTMALIIVYICDDFEKDEIKCQVGISERG